MWGRGKNRGAFKRLAVHHRGMGTDSYAHAFVALNAGIQQALTEIETGALKVGVLLSPSPDRVGFGTDQPSIDFFRLFFNHLRPFNRP